MAVAQSADPADRESAHGLPLAVGSRDSNGYWGTCVVVVIIGIALATFVAAHFYLGSGPNPLPPGQDPPPLGPALWATATALLAAVATRALTAATDRRADRARLGAAAAALALHGAFVWLAIAAFRAGEFDTRQSAYASGALGVVGFTWLVAIGAAGMLLAAVLWAAMKPRDPRGRGVALNASLVSYASAASWMVALAVVFLWPRVA